MMEARSATASKRQSMLMPRGTLSGLGVAGGIPRPTTTTTTTTTTSANGSGGRARPMSVYGGVPPATQHAAGPGAMGPPTTSASAASATTSGAGTRPRAGTSGMGGSRPGSSAAGGTSSSGVASRSQSVRKPANGHARNMSTSVLTNGGRQHVPRSQPQSPVRQSSGFGAGPGAGGYRGEAEQRVSPSRSKLPTAGLSRTSTVSNGSTSTSTTAGPTRVARAHTNSTLLPPSASLRPTSMLLPPSSRPAFSTLQQHYSPKKTFGSKPASSSLIHTAASNGAGGPAGNGAGSSDAAGSVALETQFLQAWLLQLTCLHASFHPAFAAWCASTRKALRSRFADTAARMTLVAEREMQARARRNVEALAAWGSPASLPEDLSAAAAAADDDDATWARLADSIQTLAAVLREATTLVEPSGRAAVALGWFAAWISHVESVWQRRQGAFPPTAPDRDQKLPDGVEFVDDMGDEWRAEAQGVLRRLSGLRRMLEGLPPAAGDSTVARVVEGLDGLLRGAVSELETVVATEKVVMKLEREWVDGMLDEVMIS